LQVCDFTYPGHPTILYSPVIQLWAWSVIIEIVSTIVGVIQVAQRKRHFHSPSGHSHCIAPRP
jgi:hypothetical protein